MKASILEIYDQMHEFVADNIDQGVPYILGKRIVLKPYSKFSRDAEMAV